jgi:hypothetical protein
MSMDCSVRPALIRRSSRSKVLSCASRPNTAGGYAPAFGVYGFRIGSTYEPYLLYIGLSIFSKAN